MLPYYVVLFHTSIILLFSLVIPAHQQRWFASYCIFIMAIYAAVRGYNGTDTYSYHVMFYEFSETTFIESIKAIEPLFYFLLKLTSLFTSNSFAFTALVSLVQAAILFQLVKTSKSPAEFLLIFIAVFYIDFEFNILRAGTAVMLIILASRYADSISKMKFYGFGLIAVLFHYTAIIGLLYLTYVAEKRFWTRMLLLVGILIIGGIGFYYSLDSARLGKLIYYVLNIERASALSAGVGFYAAQVLYFFIYMATVNKRNFLSQTFLFLVLLWLAWATLRFESVDRIRIVFNAIFLTQCIEMDLANWRRSVRRISIIGVVVLGLYGNLTIINTVSKSTELDYFHSKSPYIPYRFFWQERPL